MVGPWASAPGEVCGQIGVPPIGHRAGDSTAGGGGARPRCAAPPRPPPPPPPPPPRPPPPPAPRQPPVSSGQRVSGREDQRTVLLVAEPCAMLLEAHREGPRKCVPVAATQMLQVIEAFAHRGMDRLSNGARTVGRQVVVLRRLVRIDPEDLLHRIVRPHVRDVAPLEQFA